MGTATPEVHSRTRPQAAPPAGPDTVRTAGVCSQSASVSRRTMQAGRRRSRRRAARPTPMNSHVDAISGVASVTAISSRAASARRHRGRGPPSARNSAEASDHDPEREARTSRRRTVTKTPALSRDALEQDDHRARSAPACGGLPEHDLHRDRRRRTRASPMRARRSAEHAPALTSLLAQHVHEAEDGRDREHDRRRAPAGLRGEVQRRGSLAMAADLRLPRRCRGRGGSTAATSRNSGASDHARAGHHLADVVAVGQGH